MEKIEERRRYEMKEYQKEIKEKDENGYEKVEGKQLIKMIKNEKNKSTRQNERI